MKYGDVCQLLEKQQKQIEELNSAMKDLKGHHSQIQKDGQKESETKKKVISCFYCKKPGHIKANCFSLKNRKADLNLKNPVAK